MNPFALLSRISHRERIMLGSLVMVGFLIWMSSLWRHWDQAVVRHRKATHELNQQAVWLADADRFERELNSTLEQLDADFTFNASELVALIDDLARRGDLKHDLGVMETDGQELYLRHSLHVGIRNARLAQLIDFERSLRTHYPYAAIEACTLSANKADPRLLNARLTVAAYQLKGEEEEMDFWYE